MPFPFGKDYAGGRDEIEEFKIRRDMEIEEREREIEDKKEEELKNEEHWNRKKN